MFWLLHTVLVELPEEGEVVCSGNSPSCSVWQAVSLLWGYIAGSSE